MRCTALARDPTKLDDAREWKRFMAQVWGLEKDVIGVLQLLSEAGWCFGSFFQDTPVMIAMKATEKTLRDLGLEDNNASLPFHTSLGRQVWLHCLHDRNPHKKTYEVTRPYLVPSLKHMDPPKKYQRKHPSKSSCFGSLDFSSIFLQSSCNFYHGAISVKVFCFKSWTDAFEKTLHL